MTSIPARIGMTAVSGRFPKRLWCAVRGHVWYDADVWSRVSIEGGPWRLLRDANPVVRCRRCGAQEPWESELESTDLALDKIMVVT